MIHRKPPTILSNKRQAEILKIIRMHGTSSIIDLANELDVSDGTIRRNVKILAEEGLLQKIRGGVMLPDTLSEAAFPLRMNEGKEAKQRIAEHIAGQIKDGDSLILDNGSTTAYIAHALSDHKSLFVVTNSVIVANILAVHPGNKVFMAGGELRHQNGGAFGPETLEFVKKFEVRYAIFSAAAIHPDKGILVHHLGEAEFAGAIIKRAEKTCIAADSRKFGKIAPLRLCDMNQVNELVCETRPPRKLEQKLLANKVKITVTD